LLFIIDASFIIFYIFSIFSPSIYHSRFLEIHLTFERLFVFHDLQFYFPFPLQRAWDSCFTIRVINSA